MNSRDDDDKIIDVESTNVYTEKELGFKNYFPQEQEKLIKKKKSKLRSFGIVAGIIVICLVSGIVGSGITYFMLSNGLGGVTQKSVSYVPTSFTSDSSKAMSAADAFRKVSPAVVTVSTKALQDVNFGFFSQQQEVEGIGSGFIINKQGYILTNYHVIAGASEVKVTLSTEEEVPATVVNYDAEKDVAMLKLSSNIKVPAVAELGDSDAVYPGAEVIAIGTPLSKDFAHTLTKGVVSGNNRTVMTDTGKSVDLIQTDTAINPGNSGGPLVNTNGQVIGINSMKIGSQTGAKSVEGIGFAIPINGVKNIVDDLSKPILNLGIKARNIDSDIAKKYDLSVGIYVVSVDAFSPAEKSGLKIGDIIVKCDGKTVKTLDELKKIKQSKNEGDPIKIQVDRNGKKEDLTVVLKAQ